MTSPVSSYSPGQGVSDPLGSANLVSPTTPSPTPSSGATTAATGTGGEAVTLTPDAKTSTDLLEAARAATGIDLQAVQSLKAQITAGTYDVPPAKLAASIVAAMTETQS